ncbi:MAG: SPOR domain-containing protein [Bacteroidota bacterium]|nr:SPOR domain-containing protein [Bacteroidota bacterium]
MPNLNVKGESGKSSSSPSGGGGGTSKALIIVIVTIVLLGGAAFVLNSTGVVKLWGKKKAPPVVVSLPAETASPVVQDTASPVTEQLDTAKAKVEENLTKLESNAKVKPAEHAAKKTVVTGTGMYTIQIASWPTEAKATAQVQLFSDAGFEAFSEPLGGYFRVCIGRYESKTAAREQAEKMEHMLETSYVIAKVGK